MSTLSKACCTIPPVVDEGYSTKGEYVTLGGMKTYVTGPSTATKAILFICDIFGYFPQTLQGADILALSDSEQQYQIYAPDFFKGNPAKTEWYPSNTEEKKNALAAWFQAAAPLSYQSHIPELLAAFEAHNPNIQHWGAMGYCWGGKLISLLTSAPTTSETFQVAVQSSPSMVSAQDATKITIPMCVLASKDEPVDEIQKYDQNLAVAPKHVETFPDMPHGWMSARADLQDQRAKIEYERGYQIALTFFHDHF